MFFTKSGKIKGREREEKKGKQHNLVAAVVCCLLSYSSSPNKSSCSSFGASDTGATTSIGTSLAINSSASDLLTLLSGLLRGV